MKISDIRLRQKADKNKLTMSGGKTMEGYGLAEFKDGKCSKMTPQNLERFEELVALYRK